MTYTFILELFISLATWGFTDDMCYSERRLSLSHTIKALFIHDSGIDIST